MFFRKALQALLEMVVDFLYSHLVNGQTFHAENGVCKNLAKDTVSLVQHDITICLPAQVCLVTTHMVEVFVAFCCYFKRKTPFGTKVW